MHFNPILILGFVSAVIAVPAVEGRSKAFYSRAIDYSHFTAVELADVDPETCCCCAPPSQITNVDHLHRLIAASYKTKRAIDYSHFSATEIANVDPKICCCCVPPSQVNNVDYLHRLLAASQ